MACSIPKGSIIFPGSATRLGLGLVAGIALHGFWSSLIGGGAGFLIMYGLYLLGTLFTKAVLASRGESTDEIALGFGDVNLSGVLGLILGWPGITAGLLLAILLGGFTSLIIIIVTKIQKRFSPFTAIPYAPFLILGTLFLIFRPV